MNKCKSEDMGSGAWKSEPSIVASMPGNAGAALAGSGLRQCAIDTRPYAERILPATTKIKHFTRIAKHRALRRTHGARSRWGDVALFVRG